MRNPMPPSKKTSCLIQMERQIGIGIDRERGHGTRFLSFFFSFRVIGCPVHTWILTGASGCEAGLGALPASCSQVGASGRSQVQWQEWGLGTKGRGICSCHGVGFDVTLLSPVTRRSGLIRSDPIRCEAVRHLYAPMKWCARGPSWPLCPHHPCTYTHKRRKDGPYDACLYKLKGGGSNTEKIFLAPAGG